MSAREDYTVPPQITAADWNRFASRFLVKDEGIEFGGTLFIDQVNKRVGVGTSSPEEPLHVSGAARFDAKITSHASGDAFLPSEDGQGNIGNDSYRWALVRAVNIVSGDYVFENGWRLTEAEKLGLGEGIALIDPAGRVRWMWP